MLLNLSDSELEKLLLEHVNVNANTRLCVTVISSAQFNY